MIKHFKYTSLLLSIAGLLTFSSACGQIEVSSQDRFLDNVRFGGGLSLSFGNDFFSGSVSPSAIYDFNRYFSAGLGLNFSYYQINDDESFVYGASLISMFNPIRHLQISAQFQELRVNRTYENRDFKSEDDYWYPALFLGIGYSQNNVTIGIRYDVLYDDEKSIYAEAYVPFVRVYF